MAARNSPGNSFPEKREGIAVPEAEPSSFQRHSLEPQGIDHH